MERLFASKWFHLGAVSVLAAAVLVVYSNTFQASFHFDDTPQILENYKLRDLKNLPEIITGQRGVTMATFALNYAAGGSNVLGYHIVNTLIHIINGILVYLLLFHTFRKISTDELWSKKIAVYSALLFAVHPIQTQAVTYIVQRMESLASLFFLLSILIFAKATSASTTQKRVLLYAGVVLTYIVGFKSKEIAITLPAVIFLYDFYFVSGGDIRVVAKRWPLYAVLVVIVLYLAVSTIVPMGGFGDLSEESSGLAGLAAAPQAEAPSAGFGVKSISPKEYLFTQFNVLLYYVALLLVPVNQNLDYDFPVSSGLFEVPQLNEGTVLNIPIPPPVVSLAILMAIIGFALYFFVRSRKNTGLSNVRGLVVSFFIFWFFIILLPTSSFIPIIDVIFEHRVYLSSLGFFVIFAITFDWFFSYLERR
ncbi:MAG: hypothetical protein ACYSTI_13575, partial [Planctomycetota bacterium]